VEERTQWSASYWLLRVVNHLLEAQAEREEQAASAEKARRNLARTELAWLRRDVKAPFHETAGAN
jgi:hypothetical protein